MDHGRSGTRWRGRTPRLRGLSGLTLAFVLACGTQPNPLLNPPIPAASDVAGLTAGLTESGDVRIPFARRVRVETVNPSRDAVTVRIRFKIVGVRVHVWEMSVPGRREIRSAFDEADIVEIEFLSSAASTAAGAPLPGVEPLVFAVGDATDVIRVVVPLPAEDGEAGTPEAGSGTGEPPGENRADDESAGGDAAGSGTTPPPPPPTGGGPPAITDCNGNGIDDAAEIAADADVDCDASGIPDACEILGSLFSISPDDDLLRVVNPEDGVTASSVPITVDGETVAGGHGLALQPGTGTLWALLALVGQSGHELVVLDHDTGVATRIGNTQERFAGLAFGADGTVLYAITGDGGGAPETLFTLSTADGTAAKADPQPSWEVDGTDDGETLAWNPDDGRLYRASGLDDPVFEAVDVAAAQVRRIPLPDAPNEKHLTATGLVYSRRTGRFLLTDIAQDLFTVSTEGAVTLIGPMDHLAKGLAFAPGGNDQNANGVPDACEAEGPSTASDER